MKTDEAAVTALAEAINETNLGTVLWDSAPDGYKEARLDAARLYLGLLKEMGWRLSRVDETPPDAQEMAEEYGRMYDRLRTAESLLNRWYELYRHRATSRALVRETMAALLLNATPPASSLDEL